MLIIRLCCIRSRNYLNSERTIVVESPSVFSSYDLVSSVIIFYILA